MEEIKKLLQEFLYRVEGRLDVDHDELVKLNSSLVKVVEVHEETLKDHEKRIRFLERYAWVLLGGVVILSEIVKLVTGK
jgi:hypothetical protein